MYDYTHNSAKGRTSSLQQVASQFFKENVESKILGFDPFLTVSVVLIVEDPTRSEL